MIRAALFALFFAMPSKACEVALALTIDVSGSIDPGEYRLQMEGLAGALEDATVAEALIAARARVAVILWSGNSRQHLTLPWTAVESAQDLEIISKTVRTAERPWRNFSTAIGQMLGFVGPLFDDVACTRQVIDVSGDGASNEGDCIFDKPTVLSNHTTA